MRRILASFGAGLLTLGLTSGTSAAKQATGQTEEPSSAAAPRTSEVLPPDPTAAGPYATKRLDIVRSWASVDVGFPPEAAQLIGSNLVEDVSEVTYPVDASGDVPSGTFPIVVLLHGMHAWCAGQGPVMDPAPVWCPEGERPVPNYRGYRYLADVLASQGRIVVSVSANAVNALDFWASWGALPVSGMDARARLVAYHLGVLADANAGAVEGLGDALVGHVDVDRTVLIGHSRGGEGVTVAALSLERMANAPATVVGVVNLAPTAFAESAPATAATVTLLPACDGDVSDLQGQGYVERGRDLYGDQGSLRSSVWFAGGNHNYLNTEWTPGLSLSGTGKDDAKMAYDTGRASGSCQPQFRLSPEQERAVGLAYVTAFTRWAQDGNAAMLPLLDGTGTLPSTVAQGAFTVRVSSLAGPDRLLAVPDAQTSVVGDGVRIRLCLGSRLPSNDAAYRSYCGFRRVRPGFDTSWLGVDSFPVPLPGRTAVHLRWTAAGSGWMDLDGEVDLTDSSRLSARVVIDPRTRGSVHMVVRDASGASATVPLRGLPLQSITRGVSAARLVPQQAWIDPADARGIDLAHVTAVGLATTGSGGAWLLDVSHRTAMPAPPAAVLPVATVEHAEFRVAPGPSTVRVRVHLDRPAPTGAQFAVGLQFPDEINAQPVSAFVDVAPGADSAEIPISMVAPQVVSPTDQFGGYVAVYPMRGATTETAGASINVVLEGADIRTLAVDAPVVEANPGRALTWTFRSSDGEYASANLAFVDASMDYSDLTRRFRQERGLPASGPIVEVDTLDLYTEEIAPGIFRATLPLSTRAARGAWISYRVSSVSGAAMSEGDLVLTGTVGIGAGLGPPESPVGD